MSERVVIQEARSALQVGSRVRVMPRGWLAQLLLGEEPMTGREGIVTDLKPDVTLVQFDGVFPMSLFSSADVVLVQAPLYRVSFDGEEHGYFAEELVVL